jgi:sugar transferase (PEP-CTERM/EpsH1 system associated)
MRLIYHREWKLTAKLEARIARECDWSVFVSPQEAALFQSLIPDAAPRIRAIVNGVDAKYFDPLLTYKPVFDSAKPNYVFTGTMDYPPNIDAVEWFARSVLPVIRASRPDAQFHVVGSNPTPSVQGLAALEGVFVTGRVPDVRPYVAHATASVAPMRIARGIQNKVLEAMAMARPVVVTPDALEGIDAKGGQEVLIASDVPDFTQACLQTLQPGAQAIGDAARRKVLADYVWAERMRGFDELLASTAQ